MTAFPPILGQKPTTLILGSMPGRASLSAGEYYAHARNAFWPIMSELYGVQLDQPYSARVSALKAANVAVWDVLNDCHREGSLDSAIVRSSEQPNDFHSFFSQNSCIRIVGFNGQTAGAIFKRHFANLQSGAHDIRFVNLPSTSPAYAAMSVKEKMRVWRYQLIELQT